VIKKTNDGENNAKLQMNLIVFLASINKKMIPIWENFSLSMNSNKP
jgi:hypothetical protein